MKKTRGKISRVSAPLREIFKGMVTCCHQNSTKKTIDREACPRAKDKGLMSNESTNYTLLVTLYKDDMLPLGLRLSQYSFRVTKAHHSASWNMCKPVLFRTMYSTVEHFCTFLPGDIIEIVHSCTLHKGIQDTYDFIFLHFYAWSRLKLHFVASM